MMKKGTIMNLYLVTSIFGGEVLIRADSIADAVTQYCGDLGRPEFHIRSITLRD